MAGRSAQGTYSAEFLPLIWEALGNVPSGEQARVGAEAGEHWGAYVEVYARDFRLRGVADALHGPYQAWHHLPGPMQERLLGSRGYEGEVGESAVPLEVSATFSAWCYARRQGDEAGLLPLPEGGGELQGDPIPFELAAPRRRSPRRHPSTLATKRKASVGESGVKRLRIEGSDSDEGSSDGEEEGRDSESEQSAELDDTVEDSEEEIENAGSERRRNDVGAGGTPGSERACPFQPCQGGEWRMPVGLLLGCPVHGCSQHGVAEPLPVHIVDERDQKKHQRQQMARHLNEHHGVEARRRVPAAWLRGTEMVRCEHCLKFFKGKGGSHASKCKGLSPADAAGDRAGDEERTGFLPGGEPEVPLEESLDFFRGEDFLGDRVAQIHTEDRPRTRAEAERYCTIVESLLKAAAEGDRAGEEIGGVV